MASSSAASGDRTGLDQRVSWCSLFYRSRLTGCLVPRVGTEGHAILDRSLGLLPTDSELKTSLRSLEAKAQVAESTCDWQGAMEVYAECAQLLVSQSVCDGNIPRAALIALTIWAGLKMANLAHLQLKDYQSSIQHLLTTMWTCRNLVGDRIRSMAFSPPDRNYDPLVVGYEEPYPAEWEMGLMWQKLVVLFDWKDALADRPNLSGVEQQLYEAAAASIPHLRLPNVYVASLEMELCSSLALLLNADGQFERALYWIRRKRENLECRLGHFRGRACRSDATPEDKTMLKFEEVECFYDEARTVLDEAAILSHLENFTEALSLVRRFQPKLENTTFMSDEDRNYFLLLNNSELRRLNQLVSREHVSQTVLDGLSNEQKDLIKEIDEISDGGPAEFLILHEKSQQLISEKKYREALACLQSWRTILKDKHNSRSYQVDVFHCSSLLAKCEEMILGDEAGRVGGYSCLDRQSRWRSLERLERACIYYDEVFAVAIEKYHNNNSAISAFLFARALFSLFLMSPDCQFLYDKSKLPFLRKWLKDVHRVADHVTTHYGCPGKVCGYSLGVNTWSYCQHNPGWLYVVQLLFRYHMKVSAENVYKASSFVDGNRSRMISSDIEAVTELQEVCRLMQFNVESILGMRDVPKGSTRPREYSTYELDLMRQ